MLVKIADMPVSRVSSSVCLCVFLCMPCVLSPLASVALAEPDPTRRIVTCTEWDDVIVASVGGKEILRYQKSELQPPVGMDAIYRRSGYVHPVRTPSGRLVTGDFAKDHAHQRGIFSAWVNSRFLDREVDFWNFHRGTGRVTHHQVLDVFKDESAVGFRIETQHQMIPETAKPQEALIETWTVCFPPQSPTHYVFDIHIRQRCATNESVTVLQNAYGGMGLRGNNHWFPMDNVSAEQSSDQIAGRGCSFLTSEGHDRKTGNHTKARWVSAGGIVDGRVAGIAVMCHPTSFRAPQKVRLHPSKPYFCFAPMVDNSFEITPEQPYQSSYRYVVFDGLPDVALLEAEWQAFSKTKTP